jgi:rod shape-determining protein MreD
MAVLSMRARKRYWDVALTTLTGSLAWMLQTALLNNFVFQGAIVNLPLTLTLVIGSVVGSPLPDISNDELRNCSTGEIFVRQALAGSIAGLLFGAFIGALYASVLPVYPLCYPAIGWAAGYFCLRKLNQETLVCIPLVLLGTVAAELMMALQLAALGRADAFAHLAQIALPEALLNAIIAPFVYFPARRYYDFFYADPQAPS